MSNEANLGRRNPDRTGAAQAAPAAVASDQHSLPGVSLPRSIRMAAAGAQAVWRWVRDPQAVGLLVLRGLACRAAREAGDWLIAGCLVSLLLAFLTALTIAWDS